MKYYSPSTLGFYDTGIHAIASLPADKREVSVAVYTALMAAQASGQEIEPDAAGDPIAVDPVINYRVAARGTRDVAIAADLDVSSQTFQVDQSSRDNMTNVIGYATRNAVDPTATQAWILADNTVAMVTVANLQDVLDAYTLRMGVIYAAYGVWAAGEMTSHFVIP